MPEGLPLTRPLGPSATGPSDSSAGEYFRLHKKKSWLSKSRGDDPATPRASAGRLTKSRGACAVVPIPKCHWSAPERLACRAFFAHTGETAVDVSKGGLASLSNPRDSLYLPHWTHTATCPRPHLSGRALVDPRFPLHAAATRALPLARLGVRSFFERPHWADCTSRCSDPGETF